MSASTPFRTTNYINITTSYPFLKLVGGSVKVLINFCDCIGNQTKCKFSAGRSLAKLFKVKVERQSEHLYLLLPLCLELKAGILPKLPICNISDLD